jgi:deazaflavin-dependent oxidoreductase (nitroreductase family)
MPAVRSLYVRLVRPLAILIGGRPWLPRFNRQIVGLDRFLHRLTRGRLTLVQLAGLSGLMLTVRGARTGILRSTPLLCVPHDSGWLVAGSNWGAPKPPAWVANLSAADRASVGFRGRTYDVAPREATGAEREELWTVMVRTWPNYAKYQSRSDRRIRVFLLTPRPD